MIRPPNARFAAVPTAQLAATLAEYDGMETATIRRLLAISTRVRADAGHRIAVAKATYAREVRRIATMRAELERRRATTTDREGA